AMLTMLRYFEASYLNEGTIPLLGGNKFDLNLLNTFRSYINPETYFPQKYISHADDRGVFVELIRNYNGGQVSFSTTLPGKIRGNHFHTRKIERFMVIKGIAQVQLRKIGTNEIIQLELSGAQPAYVDIPVWCTHNLINIGIEPLITVFWISELYNPNDPDTFFELV
ncbi:MAG TPA: epimerase, partial [Niabella sp.]|nr:epimerase [Niabella sp.]